MLLQYCNKAKKDPSSAAIRCCAKPGALWGWVRVARPLFCGRGPESGGGDAPRTGSLNLARDLDVQFRPLLRLLSAHLASGEQRLRSIALRLRDFRQLPGRGHCGVVLLGAGDDGDSDGGRGASSASSSDIGFSKLLGCLGSAYSIKFDSDFINTLATSKIRCGFGCLLNNT